MALAQTVFDAAMALMDEMEISDQAEYTARSVNILNQLIQECYPYSDTYRRPKKTGMRSTADVITSLSDDIDLDDYCCYAILPYGLAGHLFIEDNPATANFFQQRYEELLRELKQRGMLAESEDIYDVYSSHDGKGNGIGFEWTTRW